VYHGEAFPDVMTPATWSFVEVLVLHMTFPPNLPGYRGYGRIGGRFYTNVSMSIALEALAGISPHREAARSEVARSAWVVRTWVRRAGELTGHGDDLFFLELQETVDLLRGDRAPLAEVPARRATYETYRALPPYPGLIRGRFDPIRSVVTDVGAPLSHAAIVARELGIPPSSAAATPPCACTAATGSGSTAAPAPSRYSPGHDTTARAPLSQRLGLRKRGPPWLSHSAATGNAPGQWW
jgi:PEP-utilising enzyme, mobile domain